MNTTHRKRRSTVRGYLWKIIERTVGRCGMASWGMPFEAIAAWMLTEERDKRRKNLPPKRV